VGDSLDGGREFGLFDALDHPVVSDGSAHGHQARSVLVY
jgi:hypothetical protein